MQHICYMIVNCYSIRRSNHFSKIPCNFVVTKQLGNSFFLREFSLRNLFFLLNKMNLSKIPGSQNNSIFIFN